MAGQAESVRAKKNPSPIAGALKSVEKETLARIRPVTAAAENRIRQAEAVVERIKEERPDKQLLKRADKWWTQMSKQLSTVQRRLVERTGVASQAQLRELSKDIAKLSKKLDGLASRG